jgi:hypothetical protein
VSKLLFIAAKPPKDHSQMRSFWNDAINQPALKGRKQWICRTFSAGQTFAYPDVSRLDMCQSQFRTDGAADPLLPPLQGGIVYQTYQKLRIWLWSVGSFAAQDS